MPRYEDLDPDSQAFFLNFICREDGPARVGSAFQAAQRLQDRGRYDIRTDTQVRQAVRLDKHCRRPDEMQGYLFSKPLAFDEMTALLPKG